MPKCSAFSGSKGYFYIVLFVTILLVKMILPVMPSTWWSVLGPGQVGGMGSHPTACDTPAHSSDQGLDLPLDSP